MSIDWTGLAADDLEAIAAYIAQDDQEAAEGVAREIIGAVDKLAAFPGLGRPGRVEGTRELIPGALPYVVVYETSRRSVLILRVLHTAQAWPPGP